jgi:hypothetical protein
MARDNSAFARGSPLEQITVGHSAPVAFARL